MSSVLLLTSIIVLFVLAVAGRRVAYSGSQAAGEPPVYELSGLVREERNRIVIADVSEYRGAILLHPLTSQSHCLLCNILHHPLIIARRRRISWLSAGGGSSTSGAENEPFRGSGYEPFGAGTSERGGERYAPLAVSGTTLRTGVAADGRPEELPPSQPTGTPALRAMQKSGYGV